MARDQLRYELLVPLLPFDSPSAGATFPRRGPGTPHESGVLDIDVDLIEHVVSVRTAAGRVELRWGSFDLCSGGTAGAEHAAAGFWPGDERFPQAAFYAYTSPKPDGIEAAAVNPDGALWSVELGEFLLPYDVARLGRPVRDPARVPRRGLSRGTERAGWDLALDPS